MESVRVDSNNRWCRETKPEIRRKHGTLIWLLLLLLLVLLVSSCANMNSINRRTDLPFPDSADGLVIHLDAKQRVVFAKEFGAICAEPSPDALSAFASSLGLAVSAPDKGSGDIAQAVKESAASIGLRTQSIQLMRDALYRVCEAYYSRALSSSQVAELHRRYQDVMIGVLAIEQLTGTVVAKQVGLGGGAHASASSELSNVKALLDDAKAAEVQAKSDQELRETEVTRLEERIAETETKLEAARTNDSQDEVSSLESTLEAQKSDLNLAELRLESAQSAYETSRATREAIEANHGAALSNAQATATGQAIFTQGNAAPSVDANSVAHVSAAVANIVRTVVERETIRDKCFKLLKEKGREFNPLVETCQDIISVEKHRASESYYKDKERAWERNKVIQGQ